MKILSLLAHKFIPTIEKMPTIGIAGVTIPGALDCIRQINIYKNVRFKSHQNPKIVYIQPDFKPIHEAQDNNRWDIVEDILVDTINQLENNGADFAIIPANTVHKIIDGISMRSKIPVLSLLDVVAQTCKKNEFKKVAIMGTIWTMRDQLYTQPLNKYGIDAFIPSPEDQNIIHRSIFDELIPTGTTQPLTLEHLIKIVVKLKTQKCDSIALACTELPLVLNHDNCGMPVLDTTAILAKAAVEEAFRIYKEINNAHSYNLN